MLILHLDDHKLLMQGVKRCVSSRFVDCNYECLLHPNPALDFIHQSMSTGVKIDLIITDYTHLGLNGYEFAKTVRQMEKRYAIRHPILMLTMMGCDAPIIQKGCEEKVFDRCLGKDVEVDVFVASVRQLLDITNEPV